MSKLKNVLAAANESSSNLSSVNERGSKNSKELEFSYENICINGRKLEFNNFSELLEEIDRTEASYYLISGDGYAFETDRYPRNNCIIEFYNPGNPYISMLVKYNGFEDFIKDWADEDEEYLDGMDEEEKEAESGIHVIHEVIAIK